MAEPDWLKWAKFLQATAQTGLHFTRDPFDRERYAQLCKLAAEMMASRSSAGEDYIHDLFKDELGYATPKVDVRGAVFKDDAILLVRETSDGRWTLPGGWADVNEAPAESVVREIYEESGYRTVAKKLLAVFDRSLHDHEPPYPYHVYKLFFLCDLVGGTPTGSIETDEVAFFCEDKLPALSTGRVTAGQIGRLFDHHRNPELPTDFD